MSATQALNDTNRARTLFQSGDKDQAFELLLKAVLDLAQATRNLEVTVGSLKSKL